MPSIQYSEKYYDDVFEYRRVRCSRLMSAPWSVTCCSRRTPGSPLEATTPRSAPPCARWFHAVADGAAWLRRHVVLPSDIAKLLPKQRLLSEVRPRPPPRLRASPAPGFPAAAPRGFGGPSGARGRLPARTSLNGLVRPLAPQTEWRGMGVQQSRGWVHYAIHRPEPHVSEERGKGGR